MSFTELLPQVQELSKIDKLRLMQFLATELANAEAQTCFVADQEYPIWSPYHCAAAANTLMDLLAAQSPQL